MKTLVIGNIVALIGSLLMVYTGLIKKKDKIILWQTIQIGLMIISNLILGGITGAITNIISCIRNILCYKNKLTKIAKTVLIIISIILGIVFCNYGLIGLLPIISTIIYILFMDIQDVVKFKILIIFTMVMWFLYDIYIKSYTSSIFDFMSIITNSFSIYKIISKDKSKEIC